MKRNQFYRILLTGWLGVLLVGYATTVFGQYEKIDTKLREIKDTEKLVAFFKEMPKGGDIHTHLVGAVPMAYYWDWAERANAWNVDSGGKITKGTGNGFSDEKSILKKWSVLEYSGTDQRAKADHFFNSFMLFDLLSDAYIKELLQELKKLAAESKVQYLEIMAVSPKINPREFKKYEDYKKILDVRAGTGFENILNELIVHPDFDLFVHKAADEYIKTIRNLENSAPEGQVVCRYQGYSNRNNVDLLKVFSQLYISALACSNTTDSLLVGVNIVSEESGEVSLDNYEKHMLMFKVLKQHYPKVQLSLHAGEMVPAILDGRKQGLCYNHIKAAVEVAGASRIGHGVDIDKQLAGRDFEGDKDALLTRMKSKPIVVEINLTSNDFILGVKETDHCIRTYMSKGIPCVISTDDQGILCTDWTHEYAKLYREHNVSYKDIKALVYNGILFSFASPGMKAKLKKEMDDKFLVFENKWNK